jgi:hypothetical protein
MKRFLILTSTCLLIFCLLTTFVALAGEEEAVKAVIYANAKASEELNLKAYMDTLDPSSPDYRKSETAMGQLFEQCRQKNYKFKYDVTSLEVVEIKDGAARVNFSQTTTKITGPDDFKNNMITGVHTLKKLGGKWKLVGTQVTDGKYL